MSQEYCKNCQTELLPDSKFCHHCGAKVVEKRITFKNLWSSLLTSIFGWDNKYLFTLKQFLLKPQIVLKEFLTGTRKNT